MKKNNGNQKFDKYNNSLSVTYTPLGCNKRNPSDLQTNGKFED